jgi:2-aminoethylphosphonate-pyruvate transaminase
MLLLTPGPVTTHPEVKAAFARDYAPWDPEFRELHAQLLRRLLTLSGGAASSHAVLALQGCGHFALEAAIRTFVPRAGRLLVPITGDYAERMARLAREAGRQVVALPMAEAERMSPDAIAAALEADRGISHVGLVYSETATGICHDAVAVSQRVAALGRRSIIDAVSAFGALPLDLSRMPELDAVVFTSNKCLEGMPGIGFVAASIERLLASQGNAGSWCLDLADVHQHAVSKPPGTWRFTPVPQAVAALLKALDLFDAEGGRAARLARYTANQTQLYEGVQALGFTPYVAKAVQGPIIVNVLAPEEPAWNLAAFVEALKRRGVLLSNFYTTPRPSFRVGCIGALTPADMRHVVARIGEAWDELRARSRVPGTS